MSGREGLVGDRVLRKLCAFQRQIRPLSGYVSFKELNDDVTDGKRDRAGNGRLMQAAVRTEKEYQNGQDLGDCTPYVGYPAEIEIQHSFFITIVNSFEYSTFNLVEFIY